MTPKSHDGFDEMALPPRWTEDQRRQLQHIAARYPKQYGPLQSLARESLNRTPHPQAEISYEGHLPDHPARLESIRRLNDVSRVRALGYAWLVDRNPAYPKAGLAIIEAWSRVYRPTGNPINEHKLASLMGAYGLWRTLLPPATQQSVENWLQELAAAGRRNAQVRGAKGNWHTKRMKINALVGTVTDDAACTTWAETEIRHYVAHNLYPDGSSYDFHRRDALHYHCSGLRPLLEVLFLLPDGGVDLYWAAAKTGNAGASIAGAVNFVRPFVDGRQHHAEWVHTQVELDRRRAAAGHADYQPGRIFQPVEALSLLEMAAIFEPELQALVTEIRAGAEDEALPTWDALVLQARNTPPSD